MTGIDPYIEYTVDGEPADIRLAHPVDVYEFAQAIAPKVMERLKARRRDPWPTNIPLHELLDVDPAAMEAVMAYCPRINTEITRVRRGRAMRLLMKAGDCDMSLANGGRLPPIVGRREKVDAAVVAKMTADARKTAREMVQQLAFDAKRLVAETGSVRAVILERVATRQAAKAQRSIFHRSYWGYLAWNAEQLKKKLSAARPST